MDSLPQPSCPVGVYAIRNTLTGECYVGSSINMRVRWTAHRSRLRRRTHRNSLLQRAWDRHGQDAFRFTVLDYVDDATELETAERQWLRALHPAYNRDQEGKIRRPILKPRAPRPRCLLLMGSTAANARLAAVRDKFWARVDRTADCWLWTGPANADGYGVFDTAGLRWRAHRAAWCLTCGPILGALCVLHRCDVRQCVNPAHLFLGTRTDNSADRMVKGRHRSPGVPGARNGTRTHPERLLRGEAWQRAHPRPADEVYARGTRHGSHTHPERVPRGEQHFYAKLTAAEVRAIRTRRASGESLRSLAAEFGVATMTVSDIARRATWKHVP